MLIMTEDLLDEKFKAIFNRRKFMFTDNELIEIAKDKDGKATLKNNSLTDRLLAQLILDVRQQTIKFESKIEGLSEIL